MWQQLTKEKHFWQLCKIYSVHLYTEEGKYVSSIKQTLIHDAKSYM